MSIENVPAPANDSALKRLQLALENEPAGGRQRKVDDFVQAYPNIEKHLARKVPLRRVIELFAEAYGYAVHAPRFRKLLIAERKRRAESGEVAVCASCYRPLDSAVYVAEVVDEKQEGE
ncbi:MULTISPECIES: hypothetical protein [Stenotrophomonas]|jgi:hypothetical protein|uniref:hypothetical protein n=1 Tax=Stenotrophomonas TaxID=40323 RepID=UPI000BDB777C|nr:MULTISPECIES: hypothetical protein [Stenotrophomonas]MCA7024933.1 hypothetical protein [Stenotrophomonas acidaminiphila]MCE4074634.1 hypothetical protein [Stenotrophomonas acidaminiphila]OZB64240.1 MAG: hypothetical protein B7X39_17210 [Xanthomonadales bacterium 14-68-21]OZB70774.1 MAG: hypothetical protein B7X33_02585 [Xanthomonadales bacterium 13-68-4]